VELGLAAQTLNSSEARSHYDRIQLLQRTIRSPTVLDSAVVKQAATEALSRLRRIDADALITSGRKYYLNAEWDRALQSVTGALQLVPDDPVALTLLSELNTLDQASREEIAQLRQLTYAAF